MRISIIIAALFAVAVAALNFSDPALCCNSTSEWWAGQAGTIGQNGELYAAWRHTGLGSEAGGIYFARSLDTNRTWSSDITIHYWHPSWIHADYWSPHLATVGDTVYCIYAVRPEHAYLEYHYYCSRSDDRGATWNIFTTSISADRSYQLGASDLIALPGGVIHFVFSTAQGVPGLYRIYYCRSTDGGVTFSPPAAIGTDTVNTGTEVGNLTILADGTMLLLTRRYYPSPSHLLLYRSTDNGATWDTLHLRSLGVPGAVARLGRGRWGRLHLLYETYGDSLCYSYSDDNGYTWSTPLVIVNDNFSCGFGIDGNRVFACWNDANNWTPYYRMSDDNGATWSDGYRIWQGTPFPGDWLAYDVNIQGGLISLTMHNEPGNNEGTWCAVAEWQVGITENNAGQSIGAKLRVTPNPFSRRIFFNVANQRSGDLTIYDRTGRVVRTIPLVNGQAEWHGTDAAGRRLSPGVYFAVVNGERFAVVLAE